MSNHYHLAVETPRGNLVAGMKWLQATFAVRFNRLRREGGHLFQGRYKSIIVEPGESLGPLCHYIHLNPARAKLAGPEQLPDFAWSSVRWLMHPRERKRWFSAEESLRHAGNLSDQRSPIFCAPIARKLPPLCYGSGTSNSPEPKLRFVPLKVTLVCDRFFIKR